MRTLISNGTIVTADGSTRADVLVDGETTTHHMDVDYSCHEGLEVQGGSDIGMSRGRIIVRDGAWLGPRGHGQFVRRRRPTP